MSEVTIFVDGDHCQSLDERQTSAVAHVLRAIDSGRDCGNGGDLCMHCDLSKAGAIPDTCSVAEAKKAVLKDIGADVTIRQLRDALKACQSAMNDVHNVGDTDWDNALYTAGEVLEASQ